MNEMNVNQLNPFDETDWAMNSLLECLNKLKQIPAPIPPAPAWPECNKMTGLLIELVGFYPWQETSEARTERDLNHFLSTNDWRIDLIQTLTAWMPVNAPEGAEADCMAICDQILICCQHLNWAFEASCETNNPNA